MKYGKIPRWALMGGGIALGAALLIIAGVLLRSHSSSPFPATIRNETSVPLWYPTKIPEGMSVHKDSFSAAAGVVLYRFESPDHHKLNVSLQKYDPTIDIEKLSSSIISDSKTVPLPIGTARIGTRGKDITIASITTKDSWIILTYDQPGFGDQLENVAKSLRRY